jgi:hypothetical protein
MSKIKESSVAIFYNGRMAEAIADSPLFLPQLKYPAPYAPDIP